MEQTRRESPFAAATVPDENDRMQNLDDGHFDVVGGPGCGKTFFVKSLLPMIPDDVEVTVVEWFEGSWPSTATVAAGGGVNDRTYSSAKATMRAAAEEVARRRDDVAGGLPASGPRQVIVFEDGLLWWPGLELDWPDDVHQYRNDLVQVAFQGPSVGFHLVAVAFRDSDLPSFLVDRAAVVWPHREHRSGAPAGPSFSVVVTPSKSRIAAA